MALNLLSVLPPLYNAQKVLETYATKYGKTIYVDPSQDSSFGNKPSMRANIEAMSEIAENLVQYYRIKSSVKSVYASNNSQAKWYLGMSLTFIIACIIVFGLYVYFWIENLLVKPNTEPSKDKKNTHTTKKLDWPDIYKNICIYIAILLVIVYLLILVITLYQKNNAQFGNTTDSLAHFDTKILTIQTIGYLVNSFKVTKITNNIIYVDSADPGLKWAYETTHPSMKVLQSVNCDNTGRRASASASASGSNPDTLRADMSGSSNALLPTVVKPSLIKVPDDVKYVTFFDGHGHLDPYSLKYQIQSCDLFQQIDRMKSAIVYLQTQLLKQFDEEYKTTTLTGTLRKSINDNIIEVLTKSCTFVQDVQCVTNALSNIESPLDCYSACLNNNACVAATYNSNAKMCYLAQESDPVFYTGGSQTTMVVGSGPKTLKIVSSNANNTLFLKFSSNVCGNNDPYCLSVDQTTFLPSSQGQMLYTDLFSANANANGTKGNYSFVVPAKDILLKGKAQMSTCYVNLRSWLTSQICNTIIATDTSKQYTLTQADSTYITGQVSSYLGSFYNVASGPLTDILMDVPASLMAMQKDTTSSDVNAKYIPVTRFIEKVGEMDSETFVTNMVFYSNEIMSCSEGLYTLNQIFNDNIQESLSKYTSRIRGVSIAFLAACAAAVVVAWILYVLFDKDNGLFRDNIMVKNAAAAVAATAVVSNIMFPQGTQDNTKSSKKSVENNEVSSENIEVEITEKQNGGAYKTTTLKDKAEAMLKTCIGIAIPIMIVSLITGQISKSSAIDRYNQQILSMNGTTLKDSSLSIMNILYGDIVSNNYYNIQSKGKKNTGIPALFKNALDPWAQIQTEKNTDPPKNLLFQNIIQQTALSKDIKLKIDPKNSIESLYYKYINVIESYGKCNSLFSMAQGAFPFPIMEITVYGTLLLMTFIVIGYLYVNLKPVENFFSIKTVNMLQEKYKTDGSFHENDLPHDVTEYTMETYDMEEKFKHVMMIIGSVIFLVFAIVFASLASQTGHSLENALYGGKFFQNAQCYPPNLG